MFELEKMMPKYLQYMLIILAVEVLFWGILDQRILFQSLLMGTGVGLFNLWFMVRKTIKVGNAAVGGKKMASIGTATRMSTAILATIVTLNYPQYFTIIPMILGLMIIYIVIMTDFALRLVKDFRMKER